jgi:hypothetical protein
MLKRFDQRVSGEAATKVMNIIYGELNKLMN